MTDQDFDPKRVMDLEDAFNFECHPGLDCFTSCCRDVNIFLAPYDVIRLRRALKMNSGDFLEKHTHMLTKPGGVLPLVALRMNEDDRYCPFLDHEKGCTVYEHRPWSCRLFPLNLESSGDFTYVCGPERCPGLLSSTRQRIHRWLVDQGAAEYQDIHLLYAELTSHPKLAELDVENPAVRQMIFMATYDLDRFKDFVFQTSFLRKFDVSEETVFKALRYEVDLLKLGLDWIKFGLFGEPTLKIRPEVVAKHQGQGEADDESR
jgi:Fe-S-cluster containining protein